MKVISIHLSTTNTLPLLNNEQLIHDVVLEVNNKTYIVEVKAKDTLDAAEKIIELSPDELNNLITNKHNILGCDNN